MASILRMVAGAAVLRRMSSGGGQAFRQSRNQHQTSALPERNGHKNDIIESDRSITDNTSKLERIYVMSFGETIKKLRRDLNMTQEKLAEMLSISPQAVSRWETNVAMPDISLLLPLANLFNVTTDFLLGMDTYRKDLRKAEFKKATIKLLCKRRLSIPEIWSMWNGLPPQNTILLYRTQMIPNTKDCSKVRLCTTTSC